MSPIASELTAHLGYWLRQLSNHVSYAFARKLAAKDMTVAEWVLMRVLYRKVPTSPSQLADQMGSTKGAVTKLADRLIDKALVVRKASPNDGRSQTLSLTAKGMDLVPELAMLADQNDAECFAHLSDADRRAFERILKDAVKRLGVATMPIG